MLFLVLKSLHIYQVLVVLDKLCSENNISAFKYATQLRTDNLIVPRAVI